MLTSSKKNLNWCIFIFFFLFNKNVAAQFFETGGSCNISNALCGYDLRTPIPGITVGIKSGDSVRVYGGDSVGFKDVQYSEEVSQTGCGSGTSDACFDNTSILTYQVYYPSNYPSYNTCPLYAVIMFHGGSYSECSNINNDGIGKVCTELAKRGFVVFNVEYRRGVLVDRTPVNEVLLPNIEYTSAQQWLALYRAIQDARGAIRSIVLRQLNLSTFGDPYSIDTAHIFLGGISAGSILALHTAYLQTQSKADNVFPGVKNVLGSINQNWYYADTTVTFPSIKGVLDMWGALTVPYNKRNDPGSFFTNKIPVISFHGLRDSLVWPGTVPIFFSDTLIIGGINFGKESRCINNPPYKVPGSVGTPDMASIGSRSIYSMLTAASIPSIIYLDSQMQHGLDEDGPDFKSDFGIGLPTNSDSVRAYIAGRAASFFVILAKGYGGLLQTTEFIECEDDRHGCTLVNGELPDDNCNTH